MPGLIVDSIEHAALRETVGKIANRHGTEYFLQRARENAPADELYRELGGAGLLGIHLPEEYGGGGGGLSETAVVIEELAAHGMPFLLAIISPAICGSIIAAHGSDDMKAAWLPGLADGSAKIAFALTEPDSGSNSHEVRTTAARDGDGWRISGGKYYISALNEADSVLLVTRDVDVEGERRKPLSLFLVPTDAKGLSYTQIRTKLTATEQQFTLTLEDVRVGPEALIGTAGHGLHQVFAGLNPERILAAALCNGVARYAIGKATEYARTRQVWSTPIGAHQGIAHPLAQCYVDVELARLVTAQSARLADEGQDAAESANIAKYAAAEAALRALDQAIQTHGGNGLSEEYGLADLWFVTRLMRTAPVSREMVLNFVAQTSLGLPRSY